MEVYIAELNPEGIKEIIETPSLCCREEARPEELAVHKTRKQNIMLREVDSFFKNEEILKVEIYCIITQLTV